jgi:hypothetical protein
MPTAASTRRCLKTATSRVTGAWFMNWLHIVGSPPTPVGAGRPVARARGPGVPDLGRGGEEADLGDQHRPLAMVARQCPDQFLAGERDVGVGSVDQRHVQIQGFVGNPRRGTIRRISELLGIRAACGCAWISGQRIGRCQPAARR